MPIEAIRTPEDRFDNLPDFDYPVHYAEDLPGYEGLRAAWIDTGPRDAEHTFLCLHGEPSWSFLYRRMIPVFLESGARVVAPDLYGFGRSDKPIHREDYSFDFHRNHLLALVERLDLNNISLVVQDWGGLLGLTLPVDPTFRARLSRLIVMNTALGVGVDPGPGFQAWKEYALTTPDFRAGAIIARGTPQMTAAEVAAYDSPFPDERYQAGARQFPALVPIAPEMDGAAISREAARFWSQDWDGPSFMAIGASDPVLGPPVMEKLQALIKGCPEAMVIEEAGHFVQEWGEPIAKAALRHFEQGASS
ncbi:MAG: haloalkane dehalogenase [Pseudomonadota bacterium]